MRRRRPRVDEALYRGAWKQVAERRFEMPGRFEDLAEFEQRMMRHTFADHRIDDDRFAATRTVFEQHAGPSGARCARPMHVRLLRRFG